MNRLIPGKTKVSIELFRGVTIGDLIVGAIAFAMVLLVFISNMPAKLWICIGIVALAALLLFRMDGQANYIYLLHILTYFGYNRHFERFTDDGLLMDRFEKGERQATIDDFLADSYKGGKKKDKRSSREKASKKKEKAQPTEALPESSQPKESAKERKKRIKEEDKKLKSKTVPEEEKEAIRERRRQASAESMRRMAEAKEATMDRRRMEEIIAVTGISGGFIEYLKGSYYGAALEIDPVEFRFFSEHRRNNSIENCLGRVLRSLHSGYSANIVKIDRPIVYDNYLAKEYAKLEMLSNEYENGILTEEELKARVEIEYDRINELRSYCSDHKVITSFYYLVLFESDKRQLEIQIRDAEQLLTTGELSVHRLDDKELAVFLKYSNQIDFDEHEVEKIRLEDLHLWAQPNTVDFAVRRVDVNHITTHNFRVVGYPATAGDAWLAGVMSIPGTKVVLKCRPMDRTKSIKNIDHSLQELRGQLSATGVDSKRIEIESHIESLQDLLTTLQSDAEALLECNIYITAYDIVATRNNYKTVQPPPSELPVVNNMKKIIRRSWQESGFRLNNMEFDQVQAFIGSQISALDPLAKEGRGIPSNTVAATFPWIYAHISDEGGVKLGESDGIPVFIDFFRRDSERVNSNMVIVGKSGSGKSYATKSLLTNLAAEDAKIFILDPENEYTELAANLHGQIINVGNAQYGRLNPFHIITALDDDEAGENGPSGSYATHLQFLEEFFKQIMPDCEKDAMEYLNTLVDHMYLGHDITAETDLSKLRPSDYPIFDDLYDEVLQEFQSSDNPFTRDLLRSLMNYIAKFSTGGRNANIWNGPSTVTTEENFTVFNFQSMLANRNSTIANAQMLLVLKYIDNEIIKNRDYNTKYHANRKIVVVIDEAHVFIDAKYPIALDFMFQLAKRIRKYNGMQIVITQNIKDFVGSEELARKSTAIINACQYSFIFALAPNDMQDLVTLYEKAGGINEMEQEQIVQAPRGQAFVVMSPTSRSSFTVETAPGIAEMFEQRDYQSRYFSGEQGAANWEQFVGVSREAHMLNAGPARQQEALPEVPEEEEEIPILTGGRIGSGVVLHEYEEDEFDYSHEDEVEFYRIGKGSGSVSLKEEEEEAESEAPAKDLSIGLQPQIAAAGPAMDVFNRIADALGVMAGTAVAAGTAGTAAAAISAAKPAETAAPSAKEEELKRMLAEKEDELRRLKEEMLKADTEGLPTEDEDLSWTETESSSDEEEWDEDYADEDEELVGGEGSDDEDADGEETEGDLFSLFGPDSEDEESEVEDWDDEDEDDEDEDWDDEDYDESEEDEESEDEDEDEDEDDDDFMSSFCSFAARLKSMSPFERIRANGQEVAEITLEDLIEEAKAQQERKRANRY